MPNFFPLTLDPVWLTYQFASLCADYNDNSVFNSVFASNTMALIVLKATVIFTIVLSDVLVYYTYSLKGGSIQELG